MNKVVVILTTVTKILSPYKKYLILITALLIVAVVLIPNITATFDVFLQNEFRIPEGYIFFNSENYNNIFSDNLNKILFAGVLFLAVIILAEGFLKTFGNIDREKYEQADKHGSHGTASFQSKKEIMNNYYKNKKGWFVGGLKKEDYSLDMKGAYHPVDKNLNMQMIVVGPPGSRKTSCFVLPNIFNLCYQYRNEKEKPDFIITDPKSEIYKYTATYLKDNNYEILVLDFVDLKYGDSINPINYINDDITLREITKEFVYSMSSSDSAKVGEMPFWNDQEYQLLASLIGFVMQMHKRDKNYPNTLEQVAKVLRSENVSNVKKSKQFFIKNKISGPPLEMWNSFLLFSDSEKTRSSIMGGLAEKMNLFALNGVKKITAKTTLKLEKIGLIKEKPYAIYILMPDGSTTFSPLINMYISTMFNQLYKTAYKNSNTLQVPVYTILDEFCNIGRVPNINERLATFRGRKIFPMMIMQSLAQLKNLYDSWESILSQCDTKVFLGVNDEFTANLESKFLGQTTIKSKSISSGPERGVLSLNTRRDSDGFQARSLMLPDECMRFDNDYMIMIQRSRKPLVLCKIQYKYFNPTICKEAKLIDLNKLPEVKLPKTDEKQKANSNKKVNLSKKTDTINVKNKFDEFVEE